MRLVAPPRTRRRWHSLVATQRSSRAEKETVSQWTRSAMGGLIAVMEAMKKIASNLKKGLSIMLMLDIAGSW